MWKKKEYSLLEQDYQHEILQNEVNLTLTTIFPGVYEKKKLGKANQKKNLFRF
jgi:hypothetical protein